MYVASQFAICILQFSICSVATASSASPNATSPQIISIRVGFADRYKVGLWTPVEVTIRGGSEAFSGRLSLIVPDGDGVPSRVLAPCSVRAGRETTVALLCRFGRVRSVLTAELQTDGKVVVTKNFETAAAADGQHFLPGLELRGLVITIGPGEVGVEAAARLTGVEAEHRTVSARLDGIDQLPTEWLGYEGVDAVVLSTSPPEIYRGAPSDDARLQALEKWVRMGGRLVLCGGSRAGDLISAGNPLHRFAPGRFEKSEPLKQLGALESYSGSRVAVAPADADKGVVPASRLADVRGTIEASSESGMPLVVRSAHGFGQVIFMAVDLEQPSLATWPGRPLLVAKLLDMPTAGSDESEEGTAMMHYGYNDISGQLRSALDQFARVKLAPFWLVAGLVIAYLALIGPADYFILRRLAGRMRWTWLTFSLVALIACMGAYAMAVQFKGRDVRINQADLVDVDAASGQARGTTWLGMFSPRIDSYDLSVQPESVTNARSCIAWFGLPGSALGGMNPRTASPSLWTEPYDFSPSLAEVRQVPMQMWSTKSLTARWDAATTAFPQTELTEEDQLLTGAITNTLPFALEQCFLAHGNFVYHLGTIVPGESAPIGAMTKRSELRTLLTGYKVVAGKKGENFKQEVTPYDRESTDISYILRTMMFYEKAGGRRYTGLWSDYQKFVDMTTLLKTDRAILVAQAPVDLPEKSQGATLLRDGRPLAGKESRHTIMYRFVFPVKKVSSGGP